ncbi:unnamed protein product [Paramecium octaurelia]|uniref:Transmembrane protein n=1 Tax=Paramecium octaurelia TaxID=43137 RepID=A0A8S1YNN5_PAROT|nr:unnamed protein product [Paramecium octaurelia]
MEGDQEDFEDLQQINTQIVTKSFQIPCANEPILIRFIDSLNQNKIQEKLMCSLFVNLKYYITCIGFDLIFYEEQKNYSELIRIDTKISANEICDEFFTNEDGILSLFCIGQSTLKYYSLDFQSNETLILEYDVSEQIEDKCKKNQLKKIQDQQIILFYQCSRWKVILITNNQVITLIDAQTKYQQGYITRLTFIDDVVDCEINSDTYAIYLIENNFYVLVYYDLFQKKILNQIIVEREYRIQKLLLHQKCSILMLVNELDKNDSSIIRAQYYQQVLMNKFYSINNIHIHSDLIFLQNQFELNVLVNVRINQTYQICNTSLQFFDFDNLFCQFDWKKNVLQFYKYEPLSTFIEPKQRYVYVIEKTNLFKRDDTIKCFKLLPKNSTQTEKQESTQLIQFEYNCQNKIQILWNSNNSNYFKNNTYNIYSSSGNLKVSIRNNEDFQDICFARFNKLYNQGRFQLKKITIGHISFKNGSFFYIYDCRQKRVVISVNIDKYYVLEYDIGYYFVNKSNNNDLAGVQFSGEFLSHFQLNINEEITSVKKIYSSLFIYTKASNLPLIIQIKFEQPVRYYLSKGFYQPEPILFYFESYNLKLIQYQSIIAFESKEFFRCFQFQESLIISIQALHMLECYSIVSIQNQTRSLILYNLIQQELHQISNYTIQNFSFYYPIKYQINNLKLAILIQQNNLLYIAIFSHSMSKLSLDQIIATDDSFFKIDIALLLFSFDKVWRQFLLNQFLIELELENFHLNVASQTVSMINREEGDIELKIEIENQCSQLSSLMKSSIIQIQQNKNLKLDLSKMFYGPVGNLKILNNSNVVLKGPFQFIKQLQECDDQTSALCIKLYHFQTKIKEIHFEVIIQENIIVGVIHRYSFNTHYVTWIKQQYFLCVSQFINQLVIELIQCSEKQGYSCRMVSNLNFEITRDQINFENSFRAGNLINLKGNNTQAFIIIDDINYKIKILPAIIIDIIQIEKSDNQYLILQKDSNDLELTIYTTNLHQIYSLKINEEIYAKMIKFKNFNKSKFTMKFVSCKYSGDLINIKLLTFDKDFSQLFQLQLNQQKNQILLDLQNYFRNQIQKIPFAMSENDVIQYVDDSLLVLQQTQNNFLKLYQIQEDRKLIDYFYNSNFFIQITRLNTTHFIFSNDSFVQIGLIGYELELQNYDEARQNFELLAQNEVSNVKVSLQIHIIKTNLQFTNSILLIQITCFVFILIYTRKMKSKSMIQKQNGQ